MSATMNFFDVHAHIFPGKIAAKVVNTLESYYSQSWNGTGETADLLASMDSAAVDKAVIFSCATAPEQVIAANNYLIAAQREQPDRFYAFGTLHPDFDDICGEVERIIAAGLHGIKFHPDFQRVYINEPKMMKIYEIIGKEIPLIFHMGDSRTDFSSPWRLARVLDRFPDLRVIAAHFGGYSEWDEAVRHLGGRDNLWFDTSSTLWALPLEEARRIACIYGADKLLFASDYPAARHDKAIADVLALGFNDADNEKIFHLNAEKLFGGR